MRRLLVTGASGFIGRAMVERLVRDDWPVRAAVRRRVALPGSVDTVHAEMGADTNWTSALTGVDAVLHLAGRAHVMRDDGPAAAAAAFTRINVDGTLRLARQAADSGVARFVFVSSLKVHGESGLHVESDAPAPTDPYGRSKLDAEIGLQRIAAATGMSIVIVRPPLVYGPGVRANFGALIRAVRHGIPLPFAAVQNRRSLVGIDNLIDFCLTCLTHPAAAGEVFLVSDDEDVSTPDLIRRLAAAMHRRPRLLAVPPAVLRAAATFAGQRAVAERLLGSLQVDITKARRSLDWVPPMPLDEGLARAVDSA